LKSRIFKQIIDLYNNSQIEEAKILLEKIDLTELSENSKKLYKKISALLNGADIFVEKKNLVPAINTLKPLKIIVVTPTFNSERYLRHTLRSVISQRGDFELYFHVQDGLSSDGTKLILEEFNEKIISSPDLSSLHFSWSSNKDSGMYEAINNGFDYVLKKINDPKKDNVLMTWINSDDVFATNAFQTVAHFFLQNLDACWVTGLSSLMNDNGMLGNTFEEPVSFSQRAIGLGAHDGRSRAFIQQEGTFWKYSLWRDSGGLTNCKLKLAGDWLLWKKFAFFAPLIKLSSALAHHRRSLGQLSSNVKKYYAEVEKEQNSNSKRSLSLPSEGVRAYHDHEANQWNLVKHKYDDLDLVDKISKIKILPLKMPSGRQWPKISIVTPSFNQGKYIKETIDSVLNQNYPNLEYLIIDGNSSDETMSIVNKYKDKIDVIVSESDKGQSNAINKGFKLATGDIFSWLNSDDKLAPNALYAIALAFDTFDVDLVSGICEVYENDKLIYRHMSSCDDGILPLDAILDLDKGWNAGQFFYQPEVYFKRSIWEKAGGYVKEDYFYSMDYELWARFAHHKAKLHVVSSPIAHFRSHPEQKTADPAKFKAELINVRKNIIDELGLAPSNLGRADFNWESKLKVAMVNDIGKKYGAGIAHGRIGDSFEMARHDVKYFELTSYQRPDKSLDLDKVLDDVKLFSPNLIIYGNLHSVSSESIEVLKDSLSDVNAFWITHDFWILTGRCAYPLDCTKYLNECDESCPTSNEYPVLNPQRINFAHTEKKKFHKMKKNFFLVGNSKWSKEKVDFTYKNWGKSDYDIPMVRLGIPINKFKKIDKKTARSRLGLDNETFIVSFSVSTLTDERKGGKFILEALKDINLPNLTLMLIGSIDQKIDIKGVNLFSLGYVKDDATLINAMSASDIYVGPSIEETFGQVFIEAAATGTPSIGFERSGIIDAIKQGITGVFAAFNSGSLREKIRDFYYDREKLEDMSFWSEVYARNEYGLENTYKSFFKILEKLKLIDENSMPHKTGFFPELNKSFDEAKVVSWLPQDGVSALEGPYAPDYPEAFFWCYGAESQFRINFSNGGERTIIIEYYQPIFEALDLRFFYENKEVHACTTKKINGQKGSLSFKLEAKSGWQIFSIKPSQFFIDPKNEEKRTLSFMLINLFVN
jgi:glycosyltransferase involved in cell wall biosynthesis